MVYELDDTSKVEGLFEGWQETLIYSCIQKVMGKIFVVNQDKPVSAFAFVGCFGFFAGVPDKELVAHKPAGFVIMVPQNKDLLMSILKGDELEKHCKNYLWNICNEIMSYTGRLISGSPNYTNEEKHDIIKDVYTIYHIIFRYFLI